MASIENDSQRYARAYARHVGTRELSHVEKALADPDLVSLRVELVKVDNRALELEERHKRSTLDLPTAEIIQAKISDVQTRLEALADRLKDTEALAGVNGVLNSMAEALDRVEADHVLWSELKQLIELRRRLSDTERKYEELHKYLIPASRLSLVFDRLLGAVQAVLPDPAIQRALLVELRRRMNQSTPGDPRERVPVELPASYLLAAAVVDAGDEAPGHPAPEGV